MSLPWAVLACLTHQPPLLLLYPVSYALRVVRLLLYRVPKRSAAKSGKLLADVKLEDRAIESAQEGTGVTAERIGAGVISYAEDLLVWNAARVAIISSDPGRPEYDPFKNLGDAVKAPQGRLVCYGLDDGSVWQLEVDGWPKERTFHPLGIGLVNQPMHGSPTSAILAVVNIGATFAAIDVICLSYQDDSTCPLTDRITARFVQSLEHPDLTTPNAVVPLSPYCVLATNSFGFSPRKSSLGNETETILGLPLGYTLGLWGDTASAEDGATFSERIASGISMANGLAASSDGSVLLVASTMATRVYVYDVEPPLQTGERVLGSTRKRFHFRTFIPVGFLIDNLRFHTEENDKGGIAYVFLGAGHPATFPYLAAASSKGNTKAGSRVVRIAVGKAPHGGRPSFHLWLSRLFNNVDPCVQTVFEDDGELVSTSATAASFVGHDGKKQLLVTGLWDSRGIVQISDVEL